MSIYVIKIGYIFLNSLDSKELSAFDNYISKIKINSVLFPPVIAVLFILAASKDVEMPDGPGGAVGLERWEYIQRAKGITVSLSLNCINSMLLRGSKYIC